MTNNKWLELPLLAFKTLSMNGSYTELLVIHKNIQQHKKSWRGFQIL